MKKLVKLVARIAIFLGVVAFYAVALMTQTMETSMVVMVAVAMGALVLLYGGVVLLQEVAFQEKREAERRVLRAEKRAALARKKEQEAEKTAELFRKELRE